MTNIDFNNLKTQNANTFSALDYENIMSLYVYHPWDNGLNPNIDKATNNLLNLKKNRASAVNYFSKVACSVFLQLLDNSPKLYCIVPSHQKDTISEGLQAVINNIKDEFGFTNNYNLLERTETVPKSATGGDRSIEHHLNSIKAINTPSFQDKTVFLFDDISTTGNSMKACKRLLLDAGARDVVMISFGQTYFE